MKKPFGQEVNFEKLKEVLIIMIGIFIICILVQQSVDHKYSLKVIKHFYTHKNFLLLIFYCLGFTIFAWFLNHWVSNHLAKHSSEKLEASAR